MLVVAPVTVDIRRFMKKLLGFNDNSLVASTKFKGLSVFQEALIIFFT